jgi:acyl carrier protein
LQSVIGFVYAMRPDLQRGTEGSSEERRGTPALSEVPAVPPVSPASADPVAEQVLGIVAEKTGYPKDMLELDLDLEADLGIDTVKQAETFAAIREAFDIPFQENLALREYPTMKHVVGFVRQFRPDLAPTSAAPPAAAAPGGDGGSRLLRPAG